MRSKSGLSYECCLTALRRGASGGVCTVRGHIQRSLAAAQDAALVLAIPRGVMASQSIVPHPKLSRDTVVVGCSLGEHGRTTAASRLTQDFYIEALCKAVHAGIMMESSTGSLTIEAKGCFYTDASASGAVIAYSSPPLATAVSFLLQIVMDCRRVGNYTAVQLDQDAAVRVSQQGSQLVMFAA